MVENGKVVGWYTGWRADRPFAIDMAGEHQASWHMNVFLVIPRPTFSVSGTETDVSR